MTDEASADARLLGGRLVVRQPARGHRVGTDTMLLAACIREPGDLIVDVGAPASAPSVWRWRCGRRTRGCALWSASRISFRSRRPTLWPMGWPGVAVVACDLLAPASRRAAGLANATASAVPTNPPYYEQGAVRASPHGGRFKLKSNL